MFYFKLSLVLMALYVASRFLMRCKNCGSMRRETVEKIIPRSRTTETLVVREYCRNCGDLLSERIE